MTVRVWRCRRQESGIKCDHLNLLRFSICRKCGKRRPPTRKPVHLKALDLPYEWYVERFGEVCGVCLNPPSESRKLDRDHWHSGPYAGEARGLACMRCNRALPSWVTADWLRRAADYLERSSARIDFERKRAA